MNFSLLVFMRSLNFMLSSVEYEKHVLQTFTVKHVLSGHLNTDKTKILMTDGSLMKVESIAECSPWSILQFF